MRSSPPLVPGPTPRRQLPVRATRQHFPMSHYFSATTRRGPPRREKSCWIYMEPSRAHARDGHAQYRTRWCAKRGSCLDGRSTTQRFWMRSATDVRLACVLHVRSVHQNAPLRGGHGVLGPDKGEIRTAPRPCSINSRVDADKDQGENGQSTPTPGDRRLRSSSACGRHGPKEAAKTRRPCGSKASTD